MKRLSAVLSLCLIGAMGTLFGYEYKVTNTTSGQVTVYIYTQAGPKRVVTVEPGATVTAAGTIGWCIDKVAVIGMTVPVQGLSASVDVPGGLIGRCRDREIFIQHRDYIPLPTQGPAATGAGSGAQVTQVLIGPGQPQYKPGYLKIVIPGLVD